MSRPKLTREQAAKVRSMIEDEGSTRAEAVAWVLAFEPAAEPTLSQVLRALGYTHTATGSYRHEVRRAVDGELVGCRTAHETWCWLFGTEPYPMARAS